MSKQMTLITTMGLDYSNMTINKQYKVVSREERYITVLDDNGKEMELPQWMLV